MRIIAILFLICGCGPTPQAKPTPLACFNTCGSSAECSFGILQRCPFCSFGNCAATRPESKQDLARCALECPPVSASRPTWCATCDEAMSAAGVIR